MKSEIFILCEPYGQDAAMADRWLLLSLPSLFRNCPIACLIDRLISANVVELRRFRSCTTGT
ncbi:MAG: hypothetical protein HC780_07965 [Leptolyngbyaceae cyanobacterium CSU_1_3]|nr:hypothetical protein [Leptolyngbyaceae cyanobacterium CSU_1_3]